MLKENSKSTEIRFTLATFNVRVKINDYMDLTQASDLTTHQYNPGYNTNLFDTVGCLCSKYSDNDNVEVYVMSDGEHRISTNSAYSVNDVKEVTDKLRNEKNWQFRPQVSYR